MEEVLEDGGGLGETGFSREGLIFLLAFLNPGLARLTRFCVAFSVLLDAAGMCVWVELILG